MERRSIAIHGTVQGVGFRPFVYNLAAAFDLGGFVRNYTGGVTIEVEGESQTLDQFIRAIVSNPPPLAHIERWSCEQQPPKGDRHFHIAHSAIEPDAPIVIAADSATCELCLAELLDPRDRRYRYPFLNCTNCGPRLSIVTGAPYDREQTTMASFAMCPLCRAEYEDPTNRRFHAQPTACAVCGPSLVALDAGGRRIDTPDPLAHFVAAVRAGKIGAMKGLGGYCLIADAGDSQAVALLRQRKHREEKPLAIMVRDLAACEALCEIDAAERRLLLSSARPIVLLKRRAGMAGLSDQIAGENPCVGVMLPYTPLHHLLLNDVSGVPLVMTSGNRRDDPIAYEEAEAVEKLAGIADVFLAHNRPIHVRCDDSVVRVTGAHESPIRRSRGYAPQPIPLPMECRFPILAVGGQLKATFALASDRRAIVSQHMGDLDHFGAFTAFEKDVALYERLFSLRPKRIAHDLHPDYASTRYARRRQSEQGIQTVGVQHHHAHMASCMAEHKLNEPVIGVTFDGTGFGTDGKIWGGEFLVGDYRGFKRAAHLRYVGMPGGESAVREPWRMAAAHLLDAAAACNAFERRIDASSLRTVRRMVERQFNTPSTSSAGRLFDAVAALIGVRDRVSYEGQAAVELEWLANKAAPSSAGPYLADLPDSQAGGFAAGFKTEDRTRASLPPATADAEPWWIVDTRPLIRAVARDIDAGVDSRTIAQNFHSTLSGTIVDVCRKIRRRTGIAKVVLSGGVFLNALLAVETEDSLGAEGFDVYRHRLVPPGDGGLSLGQAAIAASLPASPNA
ncbi:MAG TPA: carbamoyltransferase HypF [Tepidisphaeraceae bacterium]|jgi:hydrogenase maturation protein HypF|nr:carbamoyltransferase HypF [Tepidisphaeraceae bacterium]